jgi:hypothetical protein
MQQESGKKAVEDMTLEELDEFEDDEDEAALEMYRQQRIAEMKAQAARKKFGEIINISGFSHPTVLLPPSSPLICSVHF